MLVPFASSGGLFVWLLGVARVMAAGATTFPVSDLQEPIHAARSTADTTLAMGKPLFIFVPLSAVSLRPFSPPPGKVQGPSRGRKTVTGRSAAEAPQDLWPDESENKLGRACPEST